MDIYCPKCREAWDIDSLHEYSREITATFKDVLHAFQREGCVALGEPHGEGQASEIVSLAYELLGDDVDGAAALFEDYGEDL